VIVWQNGTPIDIGPGWGVALNERGQVIGSHQVAQGGHAFLWSNGTMTDLGTLGGKYSHPTAISDRGQVVGYSTDRRGLQHGFVWQKGVMTRLPSPAGYRGARTRALAINERNQIIGDNCFMDCGFRYGPYSGDKFAVLWTLRGHKIETRLLLDIRP
jgi:probable HAF family extracellular repeat protein